MTPTTPEKTDTPTPILVVKDLNVVFRVKHHAVPIIKNISFNLFPKQTLGIVGESGSGKSVTALSVMKLIDTPPLLHMTGQILFQGRDLMTLSNRQMQPLRGKELGFIFQEPMTALNPVLTIKDQLVEMIRNHLKVTRREAVDRAVSLLTEVGMPNPGQRMRNYPHQLSGGMRQRAMIAMALSCNPKVLIADEPTTALDVTIQAQVLELFRTLQEERQMSLLFISHDLRVIAEIADQVMVMRDGKNIESANVDRLFHSPIRAYTRELLGLIRYQ
ncbi:MAG: ABC transporter ATP-binding protein [Desulfobacteraceae bacterium]|nr:ABC transporter ATP-binding protein [Desulfobacteraceae bacterium]